MNLARVIKYHSREIRNDLKLPIGASIWEDPISIFPKFCKSRIFAYGKPR